MSHPTWIELLANSIRDPNILLERLQLSDQIPLPAKAVLSTFSCRVPEPYLHRINKADPQDPLLRQVLPLDDELTIVPGFSQDPLQENQFTRTSGLLHKYHGRVLVTLTGACAVHCRYCFRRHFPYHAHSFNNARWQRILDYLRNDNSIHEVILSGGDPLTLKDSQLQNIINDLSSITALHTLRIHTRLPVVIPQRITDVLMQSCQNSRLHTIMVCHINHPNEIDAHVKSAMLTAKNHGITLLNQSVLLKGINDRVDTLVSLSHKLFDAGILPYYVHLLDKVHGAAHFDLPEPQARALLSEVRAQLPGYLVPKLAKEQPHKPAKTVVQ